jgi:hypothetical protein
MTIQHHEMVSLDQVRDAFLKDLKMYLSTQLSDIYYFEIYHAEDEGEANDACDILLLVGTEDMFIEDKHVTLRSDAFLSLDNVIQAFQLDTHKVMWGVNRDEAHSPTSEEMQEWGYSQERIHWMLKNQQITKTMRQQGYSEDEIHQKIISSVTIQDLQNMGFPEEEIKILLPQ